MNPNNNDHGTLINTAEVRFVRLLPGPIERVWAFITDPEKRQLWLAGGTTASTPGSSFQLHFENRRHELPGETVPEKHKEHACAIGSQATITRHEPPHVHGFIWGEGEVIFAQLYVSSTSGCSQHWSATTTACAVGPASSAV